MSMVERPQSGSRSEPESEQQIRIRVELRDVLRSADKSVCGQISETRAQCEDRAKESVKTELEQVFKGIKSQVSVQVALAVSEEVPCARFVVTRYQARRFLEQSELLSWGSNYLSLKVTANSYHSVVVECPLEATLVRAICGNRVCMLLPREMVHLIRTHALKLRTREYTLNARTVTLDLCEGELFQTIFDDCVQLVAHNFYKCLPDTTAPAIPPSRLPRISGNFLPVVGSSLTPTTAPGITTYTIRLNKPEVSFLIGRQGTRIERLRQESRATIKILPIATRLSAEQLANPNSVEQQLSITGDMDSAARAICLIDTQLSAYRSNPRRARGC